MQSPAIPPDESSRLEALRALEVLDTEPEAALDALVSAASSVCDAPIALISLVDENRQWFKGNIGLEGVAETPRVMSFCAHAILQRDVFIVPDAARDPRFADNPLVTSGPDIRFYAGVPLELRDGHCVGTLCVIDRQPRQLRSEQIASLRHLGAAVTRALETRSRRALTAPGVALPPDQGAAVAVAEVPPRNPWEGGSFEQALHAAMVASHDDAILATALDGTILTWNQGAQRLFGHAAEEIIGESAVRLFPPGRQREEASLMAQIRAGRTVSNQETQHVRKDGTLVDISMTMSPVRDRHGRIFAISKSARDISDRVRVRREIEEQKELLAVTLRSIADAVITTDVHGNVDWLNPAAERMTGWLSHEAKGRPAGQVFHIVCEETRAPAPSPVTACLATGEVVGMAAHTVLVSRSGTEFGVEDSAAPIRDAQGQLLGVVLVFHDVTEQRRLSGEMNYRATHDALTSLLNRTEFETRLRRTLLGAHEDGGRHALMYVDLDQFKLVNDACGHAVGDELLQQVSRLLASELRSRDTLARLGGDEFGAILEHCTTDHALRVAQAICQRMEDFRFIHDGRRFRIGASIGLVPVDNRWTSTASILQAADTSCYAAKEAGRNRVHVWFDTDQALRARHGEMQWAERIERALDDERVELWFQRIVPTCHAATGLRGEVLVRIRQEDGTVVAPGAFLPAAERFHLASRIDRRVLRLATDWLRSRPDLKCIDMVSVNLSGQSIGDRAFHRHVVEMFRGLDPDVLCRLCLEITETVAVTNLADASLFVEQMRELGVRTALDDFGAGASSFGYLKSLKTDILKIDGQFVQGVMAGPLDRTAVQCFVEVARVVGMQTVAEFVETPEILAEIRALGVHYAQGFLLHRPEPLAQAMRLVGAS